MKNLTPAFALLLLFSCNTINKNIDPAGFNVGLADSLCKEFAAYEKIYNMSDFGNDCANSINSTLVRMQTKKDSSNYCDEGEYYKDVLQQFQIDETKFTHFCKQLQRGEFGSYHRMSDHDVFMLDKRKGKAIAYVKMDSDTATVFDNEVMTMHALKKIEGHWYEWDGGMQ